MYLEGEDVAAIDNILHSLLVVLNPGGLEDDRKLGSAVWRYDLCKHIHTWHTYYVGRHRLDMNPYTVHRVCTAYAPYNILYTPCLYTHTI